MQFILFVGANNTLAPAEIDTKIPGSEQIYPNVYSFGYDSVEKASALVGSLGSSLKLAQKLDNVSDDPASVADFIEHKNFFANFLGSSTGVEKYNQEIKNILGKGRFVLAKDYFGLSPIILKKHKVDEFFIDKDKQEVYRTVWFHDYSHWIEKDRHMPHIDPQAGMLPPKIARSMVNLVPLDPKTSFLIDPFCGSGRILVEAAEIGFKVGGSDIVAKQVSDSKANLEYLGLEATVKVLDSTHLSEGFSEADAIVTEPFLGKTNLRKDQIRYLVPGLEKLYLGSLKDWAKVLKPKGYVVMVMPIFYDGKRTYKTSEIIDSKLSLVYNQLKPGIVYSRPDAEVKREIVILQKK